MKPVPEQEHYRADIDGLRALAVIAVVIYHLRPTLLPGGFVGVDIFFVISGYVVIGSFVRHGEAETMLSRTIAFYGRRIQRLLPGYATFCFATGLLMAILVPPDAKYYRRCFFAGAVSVFGASNMFFAFFNSGSYFDIGVDTFAQCSFLHTWSLGVEEQFYCVVPPLLLLMPKRRPGLLLIAIVVSLLACYAFGVQSSKLSFYLLPSRLWEMAAGAWLYFLQTAQQGRSNCRQLRLLLEFGAICFLLLGILYTPSRSGFPFPWASLSVCGTMCYIASGFFEGAFLNSLLSANIPVYIGKVSYLIYLWHWPVITLIGEFDASTPLDKALFLQFGGVGAITTLLSALCYHYVESPFRSWRPKNKSTLFIIFAGSIVILNAWLGILNGALRGVLFIDFFGASAPNFKKVEIANTKSQQEFLGTTGTTTSFVHDVADKVDRTTSNVEGSMQPKVSKNEGDLREAMTTQDDRQTLRETKDILQRAPGSSESRAESVGNWQTSEKTNVVAERDILEFPPRLPNGTQMKGTRSCKCNYDVETVFRPPGAVMNSSLPSCVDMTVLQKPLWESYIPTCWNHGVNLDRGRLKKCLAPDRVNYKRAFFALGDSHTGMMSTAFKLALKDRFSVHWFALGYACAFYGADMGDVAEGHLKSNCKEINKKIFSFLMENLRSGDVVLVANSEDRKTTRFNRPDCPPFWTSNCTDDGGLKARYSKHIQTLQRAVSDRKATLVILGDAPLQHFADPKITCAPSKYKRCRKNYAESFWGRPSLVGLHEELFHHIGGFIYWDYHDLLCLRAGQDMTTHMGDLQPTKSINERYCYPFVPGTGLVAYIDQSHLGDVGAAYLAPFLCSALEAAGVF